jgi:hypothetical protein
MYSAREAAHILSPGSQLFDGLTPNDLEDLRDNMLFDVPAPSWTQLQALEKTLPTHLSMLLEQFLKGGVFAHSDLLASHREKLGILTLENFRTAFDHRIWKATTKAFESEMPKGADRNKEFDRLFAKYLALCKSVEISDPYMAEQLCREDSAAMWLIEEKIVPQNKSVVIHSEFFGDWSPLKKSIQDLLDEYPKYKGEISVKLYHSRARGSSGSRELFHDRHIVFMYSRGLIPVCLGSGADTFAVHEEGKFVGKLISRSQIYSSSPQKYKRLLVDQSGALLRAESITHRNSSRKTFTMRNVKRQS